MSTFKITTYDHLSIDKFSSVSAFIEAIPVRSASTLRLDLRQIAASKTGRRNPFSKAMRKAIQQRLLEIAP